MSRNLAQLKAQLGQAAQLTFARSDSGERAPIERDDVKRWDFGDLPEEITFTRGGKKLDRFSGAGRTGGKSRHPAVRYARRGASEHARRGAGSCCALELKEQMKQLEKNLSGQNRYWVRLFCNCTPLFPRQAHGRHARMPSPTALLSGRIRCRGPRRNLSSSVNGPGRDCQP